MKIVQPLKDSNIFIKGFTKHETKVKQMKQKAKQKIKKEDFWTCY